MNNVLNLKKLSRVMVTLAVAFMVALSVGFSVNRASNHNRDLIEFEVIYYDVTEYSHGVQFRLGDTLYSVYIADGQLQTAGGWHGLTEIGFAIGENGEKYRIFEREGDSIDEFIVVQDDGFMNPTVIYVADK